jgi:hypothetical protein
MGKLGMRNNKMLVFMCINLTNLCCHSVYSVLAAFFPQEAEKKGLSEDAVGIVFASFAAVIFLCSPMAGGWMTHYGKVWVYITGIVLVSLSTILFAGATTMPDGSLFGSYCLVMRLLQGVGSAMEEVRAHCAARCTSGHLDARKGPLFRLRPASAPPQPPPRGAPRGRRRRTRSSPTSTRRTSPSTWGSPRSRRASATWSAPRPAWLGLG